MTTDNEIIYLDNNATTQLDPAVIEEMLPFLTRHYGNPSSGYGFAAMARKAINLARERLAALLGCEPTELVFTSDGTVLGVDKHGNLDLAELEAAIRPETALVSVMWANNETGVIFPIEKIAEICRQKGALFHSDAVQATAKIPMRLRDTAINFLSLSAHKFHGPKGVGAVYVDRRTRFGPLIAGGGQENGRRGGTENVASIVGLGKAAELALKYLTEGRFNIRSMRDRFEKSVRETVSGASVNGAGAARRSYTSSLSFEG